MAPYVGGLNPRQFSHVLPQGAITHDTNESRGDAIIAGNAVCQIIGTLFFLARVYSRAVIINSWKAEDTTLAVAWVFATCYSICQYAQVYLGYGHHLPYVLTHYPSHSEPSQRWAFAAQIIMLGALSAPKLSICLTYLRLFYSDVWGRRLIKLLIALVVAPNVGFVINVFFQCRPISAYWTEGRPADKCNQDIIGIWVSGGLNMFFDVALVFIVLPQVLGLPLNARQRWSLICIVGLGFVAAAAGLIRMVRVGTTLRKHNFDPSWDMYDISIWTATEIYVSLVCAAAPGIKPLVSKIVPKLLGSTLGASSDNTRAESTLSVYPPGSIELKLSKCRRGTIGSARTRRNTHESLLEDGEGPYAEVGRGVDALDDRKRASVVVVANRLSKIMEVETTTVVVARHDP